jgi:uncharacterized protein YbaP (TraB family)
LLAKSKEYLKEDDYFVIIGSGHLVGASGILELLKKDDYEIE